MRGETTTLVKSEMRQTARTRRIAALNIHPHESPLRLVPDRQPALPRVPRQRMGRPRPRRPPPSSKCSSSKARKPASVGSPSSSVAKVTAPPSTTSTPKKSPATTKGNPPRLCRTPASSATGSRSPPPSTTPRAFLAVQKEHGTFDRYIWSFVGGKPKRNHWPPGERLPAPNRRG